MNQVQFGTSSLAWIPPTADEKLINTAIQKTAETGFDLIEILLTPDLNLKTKEIRKELEASGLKAVVSMNLPQTAHIPTHPEQALVLIKKAIEIASELEAPYLGGVLHSGIGVFSGFRRTPKEEDIIVDTWKKAADVAEKSNVKIGIEPVNRYESYVCNTVMDTLPLIKRVESKAIVLHLDTFHMNIEEKNYYDPVLRAGKYLEHVHMAESNRGMLGEGTINWDEFFSGLKEIKFKGRLVVENFSSEIPELIGLTSLWQKSDYNTQQLATGCLSFMKRNAIKYSL